MRIEGSGASHRVLEGQPRFLGPGCDTCLRATCEGTIVLKDFLSQRFLVAFILNEIHTQGAKDPQLGKKKEGEHVFGVCLFYHSLCLFTPSSPFWSVARSTFLQNGLEKYNSYHLKFIYCKCKPPKPSTSSLPRRTFRCSKRHSGHALDKGEDGETRKEHVLSKEASGEGTSRRFAETSWMFFFAGNFWMFISVT